MNPPQQDQWSLPRTPLAPSLARGAVEATCAGCSREVLDTALLLTTELVTNAVRHGTGPVRMTIAQGNALLRIAIEDQGPALPVQRNPNEWDTGGRGLHIVAALAARWGVQQSDEGKRVWFELPVADRDKVAVAAQGDV